MDDFDWIFEAIAAFDEYQPPEYTHTAPVDANGAAAFGERPGDDFNARAKWADILEPKGWKIAGQSGDKIYWKRPGKEERGWSATTGYCKSEKGGDLLYIFSSNADPFESEKAYSKFSALVLLQYKGDFGAAAKDLAAAGWGPAPPTLVLDGVRRAELPPKIIAADDVATIDDLITAGAEVQWLWPGWIQLGVLTAIAAPGGTGKTRFCADLVRRIAKGLPWPDGATIVAHWESLALWVVADNHHDEMVTLATDFDIKPNLRINASKADPYGGVTLESEEDYRDLEARIRAVKPLLVIVDTVGNATDKNLSRQEDAKAFYWPLQIIARKYRCAVLPLTHLNAGGQFLGRRVMEKVRVAIKISQPDPENSKRRLEVAKTNAKKPPPLGLSMGDSGNEYDDKPPEPAEDEFPGKARGSNKVKEVADWLRERLQSLPQRVSITIDAARERGFSTSTLYRARDLLEVEQYESEGYKFWRLPS